MPPASVASVAAASRRGGGGGGSGSSGHLCGVSRQHLCGSRVTCVSRSCSSGSSLGTSLSSRRVLAPSLPRARLWCVGRGIIRGGAPHASSSSSSSSEAPSEERPEKSASDDDYADITENVNGREEEQKRTPSWSAVLLDQAAKTIDLEELSESAANAAMERWADAAAKAVASAELSSFDNVRTFDEDDRAERVFLVGVETKNLNNDAPPSTSSSSAPSTSSSSSFLSPSVDKMPPRQRSGGLAAPALPPVPAATNKNDNEQAPKPKPKPKSPPQPRTPRFNIAASLDELGRLADTAGLEVVGSTSQRLDPPNPKTYVGSGKVQEIKAAVARYGVDTVIFDDALTPAQLRALEAELAGEYQVDGVDFLGRRGKGVRSVRVCDRTALILDIFSQRAATREASLQVELASIEYQLPRLTRMWTHLERQSGSGQVKGMGEKQIEVDRRVLKDKRARIQKELKKTRQERFYRKHQRGGRRETREPVVALVGYTNAGKSTLLNALTRTQRPVFAEDKLFATLDPTSRRLRLPGGGHVVLTDTVGFVQKLPTEVVEAFRATLEEVVEADLIVRVVDISDTAAAAQLDAVDAVLESLFTNKSRAPRWQRKWLDSQGLSEEYEENAPGRRARPPTLSVWNKVDAAASPDELKMAASRVSTLAAAKARMSGGAICVSATERTGFDDLLQRIEDILAANDIDAPVPEYITERQHYERYMEDMEEDV